LEKELCRQADALVGGSDAWLIIDDTALPKKGRASVGVALIFPVAGRGRPRKNHVPDVPSRPAQAVLESAKWQTVSWRRGTRGKLSARFAAMRVRLADGPPQRIGHLGQQHLPGRGGLAGRRASIERRAQIRSQQLAG
jgi:SRSO17 transposase